MKTGWLVIGAGNRWRGDDGVGARVADLLAAQGISKEQLREVSGEGTELLKLWRTRPRVAVVDAARSGAAPGTIHRFDALTETLPAIFPCSSHAFGLAEAAALARELEELPAALRVFAIEGATFTLGAGMTPAVEASAQRVAGEIRSLLSLAPDSRFDGKSPADNR